MKKIICVLVLVLFLSTFFIYGAQVQGDYVRIHVRANSNEEFDQQLKMEVKEEVVNYLASKLENVKSIDESRQIIQDSILDIEKVANEHLKSRNSMQNASVNFDNEYFPTRLYGDTLVASGNYDAVIIDIGEGDGDNWWCVVYPPLCFVGGKQTDSQKIIYKSKLVEMFGG